VRRDLLVTGVFWLAAAPLLHLHLKALAVCYAAFGFSWASQQYIYHVRTPRHAVLGAYDLRLWRRWNCYICIFNYHLTHHLAVWVPWIYLPGIAAKASESRLSRYLFWFVAPSAARRCCIPSTSNPPATPAAP